MRAFQRAYADLAASPALCLAVRSDPAAALARYDLDDRDRARLTRAAWQRGMDANCTLYRATRVTALNAMLPITLSVMRPVLRDVLDRYWADEPVHERGFARESARFLAWLEANPQLLPEPAQDIIALARRELAIEEARLERAGH